MNAEDMVPVPLGCFEEKGDDTGNRLCVAPGTKQMFSKHLGLSLLLPWALTNAPDPALRVHKSIPLGLAGLPRLHDVELYPLTFQTEASNPDCWEVPFNKLGNFQKILPLLLGASHLAGSNPGDMSI